MVRVLARPLATLLRKAPRFARRATRSLRDRRIPASLLRAFQPLSRDSFHCVYSGLRPIYATQSHPQMLLSTYAKSLSGAKLRSGNAPKRSGGKIRRSRTRRARKRLRESPNARSSLRNLKRDFHLAKNENRHFTLCLLGRAHFHARSSRTTSPLLGFVTSA